MSTPRSPTVFITYRSLAESSRSSRGSFSRDGRVRQITPRRRSYWRRLCYTMPWKSICIVLLFVALSAAFVPLHYSLRKSPTFVIENKKIGGELNAKVLRNTKTGEYAEVVVDYGGRVEELHLKSRSGKTETVWSVILTHDGNATAIKENAWWRGMLLLPYANRIAYGKYTFFNDTYQLPVNENTTTQHNALHGFMAHKIMTVSKTAETDTFARLELSYSFTGTEQGYPFLLDITVFYTLSNAGLNITVQATNRHMTEPLPFYMGWHPYFNCTAYLAHVILDPCTSWNHIGLNANKDPTGITTRYFGFNGSDPIGGNKTNPTPYDDEFKPVHANSPECQMTETKLVDTKTHHTVVLWQDSAFKFVQIFTGSSVGFHEDSVAIEPMSAAADSYNNHDHLSILSGGEVWTGSFGVYVE